MASMVEEGGYASVLGFFTYAGGAGSIAPRLRQELRAVRERHPDRLYVLCVQAPAELVRQYEADGYAVFEDPTRAVAAIGAMGRYGEAYARAPDARPPVPDGAPLPPSTPDEAAAKRLLSAAGIACAPEQACADADAAVAAAQALGYPVVLKILSADILQSPRSAG